MDKYFDVNIEFNKKRVDDIIEKIIIERKSGYVCSVNANIVSIANKDEKYKKIINKSLVNICDGSILAKYISIIYKGRYYSYVGADLFIEYIKNKKYRYLFLGNTEEVLSSLKLNLKNDFGKQTVQNSKFMPLPISSVDKFDYQNIANEINIFNPDIIWVSLGAPKQEEFMYNILPYIKCGVMFGFGAILNFYSGLEKYKRAPDIFLKYRLEWLYRLKQEPHKTYKRLKNEFLQMIILGLKEKWKS